MTKLLDIALELDQRDALFPFRKKFATTKNEIYLDGNSLGKLPLEAKNILQEVIEKQWGENLIRSWNDHWLELPKRIGLKIANLFCVNSTEILVGESTSINLYKIVHGLLQSRLFPQQLISDSLNFPTDSYILDGLSKQFDLSPVLHIRYSSDLVADLSLLKNSIQQSPGIICLSLVTYKSAYLYPMKALNEFAEQHRSIIVWDLSHAAGVVAINLKATHTKVAIGCTYKYLNGGPGAPSFLYLEEKLHSSLQSPIQGWFGHQRPFDFSPTYTAAQGITKFEAGTPTILSLAAMEAGINLTLEAGIERIRSKSIALTDFLIKGIEQELLSLGYRLESPNEATQRGAHIALSHPESWRICQCLLHGNGESPIVIPDFRPPHYLRLGIAPLYISFEECWQTVQRLKQIVIDREYQTQDRSQPTVT